MNINVTLLFAQAMYEKVALAYIAGSEQVTRLRAGTSARWPAWPAFSSAASTAWWMEY